MILVKNGKNLIKENTFGGRDEREINSGYSWKLLRSRGKKSRNYHY